MNNNWVLMKIFFVTVAHWILYSPTDIFPLNLRPQFHSLRNLPSTSYMFVTNVNYLLTYILLVFASTYQFIEHSPVVYQFYPIQIIGQINRLFS